MNGNTSSASTGSSSASLCYQNIPPLDPQLTAVSPEAMIALGQLVERLRQNVDSNMNKDLNTGVISRCVR